MGPGSFDPIWLFVNVFISLTLFDGEVAHGKDHSVAWVDVVTTVDMFTVDRETAARNYFQNSFRNNCNREHFNFNQY